MATYSGTSSANRHTSGSGNDILIGGAGNDWLNGGAGYDMARYSGKASDYSIVTNADGSQTITDLRAFSPDGTDTLIGIEEIVFGATPTPVIASVIAAKRAEGDGSGATMDFTVRLSAASTRDVRLRYATADDTAQAGRDYVATSGILTIAAGQLSGLIRISIIGDRLAEINEAFRLNLSAPEGAGLIGGGNTLSVTGTLVDDDAAPAEPAPSLMAQSFAITALPVISVASVSRNEGDSGEANLTFTVKLSAASTSAVTVKYATANGTAIAGSDYTGKTGTLTIAAGATSGTIAIKVTGDTYYELNETFSLKLSSASGATLAGGGSTLTATGTIKNDDVAPVVSIANVAVGEAHVGTADAVFTITLSKKSGTATTISYTTVDGTAKAGEDYTAVSGTITIPAWTTTATIPVSVFGDVAFEADESFSLVLSAANGATFAGGASTLVGTATILNDDSGGTTTRISTTARGAEANGASSAPSISPDGTKMVFTSSATNLVAGDTNGVSDVFLKDINTGAISRLSVSASGGQLAKSSSGAYFVGDGSKVAFTAASSIVSDDTHSANDLYIKDLATGSYTRVYTTSTGVSANDTSNYGSFSQDGTKVAFQSYATNLVAGDTNGQSDIFVKDLVTGIVTRVSTVEGGAQANGSSGVPVLSPDGTKVAFQSSATNFVTGDTNIVDVFVKDLVTGTVLRVSSTQGWGTANNSSSSAMFSPDSTKIAFVSRATNLVPGSTTSTDDIFVRDLLTGTLTLASSNANGVPANGSYALIPVFSPDGTKLVFYSDATNMSAGDTPGTGDVFMKDLASGAVTRLSISLTGGNPNNYTYQPAPFSSDGTKAAFWSAASDLVPGDANGVSDIFVKNITFGSTFSILGSASATKAEGGAGATTPYSFTVIRNGDPSMAQNVSWSVSGSGVSAASASDFSGGVLPSGTLSFAAGQTSKTITINVAGDTAAELNESFAIRLSNATGGASIASSAAFATILNDDSTSGLHAPVLTVADKSVKPKSTLSASSLFTVADTGGLPIVEYQFMDNTSYGGYFTKGGVTQSPGSVIDIMASSLSTLSFVAGSTSSTNDGLSVRASNGVAWSSWSPFRVLASAT